jgi:hypothetical protein
MFPSEKNDGVTIEVAGDVVQYSMWLKPVYFEAPRCNQGTNKHKFLPSKRKSPSPREIQSKCDQYGSILASAIDMDISLSQRASQSILLAHFIFHDRSLLITFGYQ